MNPDVTLTLRDAVDEVLGLLTGLDLSYHHQVDRFRAVTRQINRALRANALEKNWSYYSSLEDVGLVHAGDQSVELRPTVRPRLINDDAVRLVAKDGQPVVWAYFLPRDALHKYPDRRGLWVAHTRSTLLFSRPFYRHEDGLRIMVPVMREPRMLRIPVLTDGHGDPLPPDEEILDQPVDFDYPDVIILRAAFYYAQTDPIMQPRAQMLEAQYKDLMYQLVSREDEHTDAPYLNDFFLPIQGDLRGGSGAQWGTRHPHSDERG